jgi:anti-sigma factor RsiW
MAGRPARSLARSCEDARLLASLELDGELDEVGALQLRRHLASCPECASWVAEMMATTSLLRSTPFEPVPTDLAPGASPKADPTCSWSAGAFGDRSFRLLARGRAR